MCLGAQVQYARTCDDFVRKYVLARGADPNKARTDGGATPCYFAAQNGHAGVVELLLARGADPNKACTDGGYTPCWIAAQKGHADVTRLLVARGATLPPSPALHGGTLPALAAYLRGARHWTQLHRAADARDVDGVITLVRERVRSGLHHDGAVESSHPHMRTALAIAGSSSYPTALPVDPRCLALLRCGAVWSVEKHALFPDDEKMAARARALLMGGVRLGADGKPHAIDIGPARQARARGRKRRKRDGFVPTYSPTFLPRDVWGKVFSFLIFE